MYINQPRVHFSPVVSQFRYQKQNTSSHPLEETETEIVCSVSQPDSFPRKVPRRCDSSFGSIGEIERVTIQEMNIPQQQTQTVQRILVSVPSGNGAGSERFSLDMNNPCQNHKPSNKLRANKNKASNDRDTNSDDAININSGRNCLTSASPRHQSLEHAVSSQDFDRRKINTVQMSTQNKEEDPETDTDMDFPSALPNPSFLFPDVVNSHENTFFKDTQCPSSSKQISKEKSKTLPAKYESELATPGVSGATNESAPANGDFRRKSVRKSFKSRLASALSRFGLSSKSQSKDKVFEESATAERNSNTSFKEENPSAFYENLQFADSARIYENDIRFDGNRQSNNGVGDSRSRTLGSCPLVSEQGLYRQSTKDNNSTHTNNRTLTRITPEDSFIAESGPQRFLPVSNDNNPRDVDIDVPSQYDSRARNFSPTTTSIPHYENTDVRPKYDYTSCESRPTSSDNRYTTTTTETTNLNEDLTTRSNRKPVDINNTQVLSGGFSQYKNPAADIRDACTDKPPPVIFQTDAPKQSTKYFDTNLSNKESYLMFLNNLTSGYGQVDKKDNIINRNDTALSSPSILDEKQLQQDFFQNSPKMNLLLENAFISNNLSNANDFSTSQFENPPIPKPRTKKSRANLKAQVEEDIDELSANVENILEEIADLEYLIDNPEEAEGSIMENPTAVSLPEMSPTVVNKGICRSNNKPAIESHGYSVYNSRSPHRPQIRIPSAMKPPLPPSSKLLGVRQQFFRSDGVERSSSGGVSVGEKRSTSESHLGKPEVESGLSGRKLDEKLSEVRYELHRSREELARWYPKVEEIESSVRSSMAIDRCGGTLPRLSRVRTGPEDTQSDYAVQNASVTRESETSEKDRDTQIKWATLLAQATKNYRRLAKSNNGSPCPSTPRKGVVETDLDTGTSREISSNSEVNNVCNEWKTRGQTNVKSVNDSSHSVSLKSSQKTQSMMNLGSSSMQMSTLSPSDPTASRSSDDRARSMEFLLEDSTKNAHLRPPENTLMSRQDRQPSEHELRIQRSLQKLNVPDWYKSYVGSGSKADSSSKPAGQKEFGSGTGLAGGWTGLSSSKTSSLTSLQSTGRYSGSRSHFSRFRNSGTASTGGRSSRESLMSPSSTASASPSPYYERSSFTYGMPYALTRFASARMSCGASPASLSPSPSPVGGIGTSTSTPVSSGPMSRHAYTKQPYLGWRSQERLTSKSMYRSPSERLAADLLAQKNKTSTSTSTPVVEKDKEKPTINIESSPKEAKETASDLSLNNSEESNSHKLNRVRSSIKEVSNAIVDYVNESKPLDDGTNGGTSPRKGLVWLESSFVGTKPIDSPSTPDTPTIILSSNRATNIQRFDFTHNQQQQSKKGNFRFDESNRENYHVPNTNSEQAKTSDSTSNPSYTSSYLSRNEQMEERSNSSSVSSPTLEDILDSLLALRRPNKKIRSRGKGHVSSSKEPPKPPPHRDPTPVSDWQDRMNQPLADSAYFPDPNDFMRSMPSNNSQDSKTTTTLTTTKTQSPCRGESLSTTTTISLKDLEDKTPSQLAIDDFDMIDKEENAFGTATEIHSTSSCAANAPPTNESSNPPTPRHRRVSFDLDISDKEEKSSSRSRRDESVGGTIHCRNSKCAKSATGLEARREFKTCHNCNAYYCTRECRRAHWEKHKKVCMQSRVGALCKQIINHVKEDSFVVSQLSAVAKRGYLAKSRGCVKLFFSSPDRAERFLTGGLPELPEPWYIPHGDMLPEEMGASIFQELSDQCRTYNAENRFVLYVSVCVVNEVPTSGAVKWEREMISRSAKLRLLLPRSYEENQRHHHAAVPSHFMDDSHQEVPLYDSTSPAASVTEDSPPTSSENDTLILRSVPTPSSHQLSSSDHRKIREVSFANIQKHLNARGVDLRRTYPDIYSKLISYVEHDEPFVAVTIYPRNANTGRQFICVIMPESSDSIPYTVPETDTSFKIQTIDISEQ